VWPTPSGWNPAVWCGFKKGVTPSLKQPFTLTLKAQRWTDFCLPYKFDVRFKELIKANEGIIDSLRFCRWVSDGEEYTADELFNRGYSDLEARADTFCMSAIALQNGFTVFNKAGKDLTLKIPPLAKDFLPVPAGRRASAPEKNFWNVWLEWRRNSDQALTTRIRCGVDGKGGEQPLYSPLPPSFRGFGAGVFDAADQRLYGHVLAHRMDTRGIAWEIHFYNGDQVRRTIQYRLDNLAEVPAGMQARLIAPGSASLDAAPFWQEMTLEPNSTLRRWLVVGTSEFLADFSALTARPLSAQLLPLYPNPACGKRVAVQYRLPRTDFSALRLSLYDLTGRRVWLHESAAIPSSGEGECVWNGRDERGNQAAGGLYLLRLQASDKKGRTVTIGEQRLTYLP
jgi:hypothetical protein